MDSLWREIDVRMTCLTIRRETDKYTIFGIYVFITNDELKTIPKYCKYF
jgi:hypothetical protein